MAEVAKAAKPGKAEQAVEDRSFDIKTAGDWALADVGAVDLLAALQSIEVGFGPPLFAPTLTNYQTRDKDGDVYEERVSILWRRRAAVGKWGGS